ncbi:MAG: response regulator [Blastococcus sp.]
MTTADPPEAGGHVLVVEDEPQLRRTLSLNLQARGYRVSDAATGSDALQTSRELRPDVIVLDLGLPDMDGLEVIRRIREGAGALPIIVLSARSASQEKVAALDLGATDYVTKPFDMEELAARLRAATRRQDEPPRHVVPLGSVVIDFGARTVRRHGETDRQEGEFIHLTPTEWRMLEVLVQRPGWLVPPAELLAAMRPGDPAYTASSYLRFYIQQLRRKLEADPSRPRHLITEPGLGYRFQA